MEIAAIWADILNFLGQAWWIEISTVQPRCIYYFGPFANAIQAKVATPGYIKDLESESAQGIAAQVKRAQPHQLTIDFGEL